MSKQNSSSPATSKYRPSLSVATMQHILHLAQNERPLSQESYNIIKYFTPFLAKIGVEAVAPSYSTLEKVSLETQLGLGELRCSVVSPTQDKKAYWKQCYDLLQELGEGGCLLGEELKAAQEWRYIEGLMTEEEELEHERTPET